MSAADPLVVVCLDPRDQERARVRLSKVGGVGFDTYSDGIRSRFPRQMLVAFIAATDLVDGELRRPAAHGPMPDLVKVAITRVHNQATYPILERLAAARRIAQMVPPPRVRSRLNPPAIPRC